jgi:hypothetical protein
MKKNILNESARYLSEAKTEDAQSLIAGNVKSDNLLKLEKTLSALMNDVEDEGYSMTQDAWVKFVTKAVKRIYTKEGF